MPHSLTEPRDRIVRMRMTPSEYARMQSRMQQLGIQSTSAYLRKMALDGYCINLNLAELRELVRLLRYTSNNMNQYAHKANATGSIYQNDIQDLQKRLIDLQHGVKEVLSRLTALQ